MLVFILFISLSVSLSQTILLMDFNTYKPIKNVNVFDGINGTTTDSLGLCYLENLNKNNKITFSMIGYKNITFEFIDIPKIVYLENESLPMELIHVIGDNKKSRKRYTRLEKHVRKVYPYAKKISDMLVDYSSIIDSLEEYSGIIRYQKKRIIFSKIEKELIAKHGYSIKKLKKSQGRILIRLIDRETNRTSYDIIKDFRNMFSASFWQITARVFGHNLRSVYNKSKGEDRIIEYIINKIENERLSS